MRSNYSESQLQLAQAYADVRATIEIIHIDENGRGVPAKPLPLEQIVELLQIDGYRTFNK